MHSKLQLWQRSQFAPILSSDRREAPRCQVKRKVVLRFSVSSLKVESGDVLQEAAEIVGETLNLSETGLAVSVPSNRIGNRYLNVIGCKLYVTLSLPGALVQMHATPKWCSRLALEEKSDSYLIGLRVTEMDDRQWVMLVRYVRKVLKQLSETEEHLTKPGQSPTQYVPHRRETYDLQSIANTTGTRFRTQPIGHSQTTSAD
jgi:hypothetical protein